MKVGINFWGEVAFIPISHHKHVVYVDLKRIIQSIKYGY